MFKRENRDFYNSFFAIYIVLVLQNIVTISVNLADNLMLGGYSEVALSGVASVNQIQFVYQQILNALGDGAVIFCSQYWGKKHMEPMRKIAGMAMQISLMLSIVLFVAVSIFPSQAVGIFTTDAGIIAEGVRYLRIVRFTYLFFAVTTLSLAALRSVEIVKIAFYLSIMTFFINCGLNWVLIYGRFGFPQMGAAGAAVGTLCARVAECMVMLVFVFKKDQRLSMKFKNYLQFDPILAKDYFKIAGPIIFVQALWGLNTALQTVILGHMTASAIAANSVASTLFMVMKSWAYGGSAAASVIIGKTIGTGDMKLVKYYARLMQQLFLCIGLTGGICLFILRIPILHFYNLSPQTMQMANQFLIILSVIFVGMAYQMPTNNGIIRGGGSPMFVVKLDIVSIWMIVLPLSFFMAFVVKASPLIVIICLNADQIFKCVPIFLKVNFGNWAKILTRD